MSYLFFKISFLSRAWHTHELTNVCSMNKQMKWGVDGGALATSDCQIRPGGWECSGSEWGVLTNGLRSFLRAVWIAAGVGGWSTACSATVSFFPSEPPQENLWGFMKW